MSKSILAATAGRGDGAVPIETLSNGMRVLCMPSTANAIVAAACFIPLPGAIERVSECGLISFTARMLMRGSRYRTNAELAEAIDSLGTEMSVDASDDYSHAHLVSTTDCYAESVRLLAEVVQSPSFEPEEIEKERQATLAAIRRRDDDKLSFTLKRFMRELYGDHSYGLARIGLLETVGEFTRDQMLHIHQEFFDPSRFLFVCVGNFDPSELKNLLGECFSKQWPYAAEKPYQVPKPDIGKPQYCRLSRDCEQSFLVAGFHGCSIDSKDFAALRVLNTVLGEGMSSRLFAHLREELGLAYATGSSFSAMKEGGHLFAYIGTKPESLAVAKDGMLADFERLKQDLVPEDELDRSKNYVIGKFLIDHQTNFKRAFYLGFFETIGIGTQMDELYPEMISQVTAEQVRDVARRYLTEPTIVELIPEQKPV